MVVNNMKKILIIVFWTLISFENAIAGRGATCALEVDVAQQDGNSVRFEVYNPSDTTMIITGVKYYYTDDTLWREYSDVYKSVSYKRNLTFYHSVKIPMDKWRYHIVCNAKAKRTFTPPKKKSGSQKLLDKILGN